MITKAGFPRVSSRIAAASAEFAGFHATAWKGVQTLGWLPRAHHEQEGIANVERDPTRLLMGGFLFIQQTCGKCSKIA